MARKKYMFTKIKNHKISKTVHKVVRVVLTIAVIVLLPAVVFTLFTSKTEFISGIRSFVVLTGSMTPTIPVGSVTYTQSSQAYNNGDIVAFTTKSGQTVTHRIVEIVNKPEGMFYQTKGDANNIVDSELIPQKNINGKVVFSIPFVGRFINFLKTPLGFTSLIVLPAFAFISFEIFSIKRELEKEVEKRMLERIELGTSLPAGRS